MLPFPLRVTTLNLNGVRSAANKGVDDWLRSQARPDVLCVQELKALEADMTPGLRTLGGLPGAAFQHAEKPGYSGVGLYWKHEPDEVRIGFGHAEFDAEGRYVEAIYKRPGGGRLSIVSAYFPSGSSSEERQQAKFRFLADFYEHLLALEAAGEVLLCGDVNIAHKEIDLKNWKGNLKNSGFLPEERAWMTRLIDEAGYVDVFRQLDPAPDRYTWWSNRGQARAKNVGWRIDYHLATPGIAAQAKSDSAWIYTEQRFSDHAPLTIDYA
ncbi:exodeoxyribonuclease III [Thiomonas sp.]|jgi:exodeoxyribonuclease-3|uniref:exodeoxyribonuclease III n=1 Tax=Thiomonas sp. TaxID=2047785 RepID=UPI00258BF87C|nr:exodeoxyribonuclease III [Thiomonas sp.]